MSQKIYTKTGDLGETSLFNGKRVMKNHPAVETYGTVDELNSSIGLALAFLKNESPDNSNELIPVLLEIQNTLFDMGAFLATPQVDWEKSGLILDSKLNSQSIQNIEEKIDHFNSDLTELKNFILPGGPSLTSAHLHQARTICRRAERILVGFSKMEQSPKIFIIYINRLSDFLFVAARWCNHQFFEGEEILWGK